MWGVDGWSADSGLTVREHCSVIGARRYHIDTQSGPRRDVKTGGARSTAAAAEVVARGFADVRSKPEIWDRPCDWIPIPGREMVHAASGERRPLDRDLFQTGQLGSIPDPKHVDEVRSLLADTIPDPEVRRYLMLAMGTALTGKPGRQVLILFTGPTGAGKSTLAEAFFAAFGSYGRILEPTIVAAPERNGPTVYTVQSAIAELRGGRLVYAGDLPRGATFTTGFKALAADSKMKGRDGMKQVDVDRTFLIVACANEPPDMGGDVALPRRIVYIPVPVGRDTGTTEFVAEGSPKADPKVIDRLKGALLPAFVSELLRAARQARRDGMPDVPEACLAIASTQSEVPPIDEFLLTILKRERDGEVDREVVLNAVAAFCEESHVRFPGPKGVTRRVFSVLGGQSRRKMTKGESAWIYTGVAWR